MGNEAHRGYEYRGKGHMGNRGTVVWVQSVWATWAMGPMGNWHIFAY